jgi:hypothetical protein
MPCCDFCIHAIHDKWIQDGREITGGPIGCKKHLDKKHQAIAENDGYCKDFHCFNVKEDN